MNLGRKLMPYVVAGASLFGGSGARGADTGVPPGLEIDMPSVSFQSYIDYELNSVKGSSRGRGNEIELNLSYMKPTGERELSFWETIDKYTSLDRESSNLLFLLGFGVVMGLGSIHDLNTRIRKNRRL